MCGTSSSPTARAPRAVSAFMAPAPWPLLKHLQCSADQHSFAGRTAQFGGIRNACPSGCYVGASKLLPCLRAGFTEHVAGYHIPGIRA